jgi:hypothetical protein
MDEMKARQSSESPNPKEAIDKARNLIKYKQDKEFLGKVIDA